VLAALLPLGVAGISAALAAAPGKPAASVNAAGQLLGTAARLQSIRTAVSQAVEAEADAPAYQSDFQRVWWGNGGWRNGGWPNFWRNGGWRNWHNGWGNGWRNGGWPNFWRNW